MEDAPEQKKILNSIAYHWFEGDERVIHFSPTNAPEAIKTFTKRHCDGQLMGRLAQLPLEILHLILNELDFESIGAMRRLNGQSKDVVEMFPAYRDITLFAHEALRALSATRLLSSHSANSLYSALCQDRCVGCDNFGSFLFLPTASRCCYSCVAYKEPELDVVSVSVAGALFGLAEKALKPLTFVSVPGQSYGPSDYNIQHKRLRMVCRQEARTLGILIHGSEEQMGSAAARGVRLASVRRGDGNSHTIVTRSRSNTLPRNAAPHTPHTLHAADHDFRFMACTPFPYLDVQRGRIEQGLCCRGCEYEWQEENADDIATLFANLNKAFSEEEFLTHFENCPSARMLWDDYYSQGRDFMELSFGFYGFPSLR